HHRPADPRPRRLPPGDRRYRVDDPPRGAPPGGHPPGRGPLPGPHPDRDGPRHGPLGIRAGHGVGGGLGGAAHRRADPGPLTTTPARRRGSPRRYLMSVYIAHVITESDGLGDPEVVVMTQADESGAADPIVSYPLPP